MLEEPVEEESEYRKDWAILVQVDFEHEDNHMIKELENEAVYSGKRLTTDVTVPGHISSSPEYAEYYKETLKASEQG